MILILSLLDLEAHRRLDIYKNVLFLIH